MTETGVTLETTAAERAKWIERVAALNEEGTTPNDDANQMAWLARDVDRLLSALEAKDREIERLEAVVATQMDDKLKLSAELSRLKSRPTSEEVERALHWLDQEPSVTEAEERHLGHINGRLYVEINDAGHINADSFAYDVSKDIDERRAHHNALSHLRRRNEVLEDAVQVLRRLAAQSARPTSEEVEESATALESNAMWIREGCPSESSVLADNMFHAADLLRRLAAQSDGKTRLETVAQICRAVCEVEGLDPDEYMTENDSLGTRETDPNWTRYAAAVDGALSIAAQSDGWRQWPETMSDDLAEVLGRPNFTCAHIAQVLRGRGAPIAKKAEAEQAAVIFWLVNFVLQFGSDWRDRAETALRPARVAI